MPLSPPPDPEHFEDRIADLLERRGLLLVSFEPRGDGSFDLYAKGAYGVGVWTSFVPRVRVVTGSTCEVDGKPLTASDLAQRLRTLVQMRPRACYSYPKRLTA